MGSFTSLGIKLCSFKVAGDAITGHELHVVVVVVDDDDDDIITGIIAKTFRTYLSNIPRKHEIKDLKKSVILGTAHILRKVLT